MTLELQLLQSIVQRSARVRLVVHAVLADCGICGGPTLVHILGGGAEFRWDRLV